MKLTMSDVAKHSPSGKPLVVELLAMVTLLEPMRAQSTKPVLPVCCMPLEYEQIWLPKLLTRPIRFVQSVEQSSPELPPLLPPLLPPQVAAAQRARLGAETALMARRLADAEAVAGADSLAARETAGPEFGAEARRARAGEARARGKLPCADGTAGAVAATVAPTTLAALSRTASVGSGLAHAPGEVAAAPRHALAVPFARAAVIAAARWLAARVGRRVTLAARPLAPTGGDIGVADVRTGAVAGIAGLLGAARLGRRLALAAGKEVAAVGDARGGARAVIPVAALRGTASCRCRLALAAVEEARAVGFAVVQIERSGAVVPVTALRRATGPGRCLALASVGVTPRARGSVTGRRRRRAFSNGDDE